MKKPPSEREKTIELMKKLGIPTTSYNVATCLSMSPARMRIHANYLRGKEYYDLCGSDIDKTHDFPDFIS